MKNVDAINKIISELAMKDYLAYNPRLTNGKPKYKQYRPYTLSAETNEAREILHQYLHEQINEEEYKSWCLRYNLIHK